MKMTAICTKGAVLLNVSRDASTVSAAKRCTRRCATFKWADLNDERKTIFFLTQSSDYEDRDLIRESVLFSFQHYRLATTQKG